ncbi:MAG: DNA repair protein RecO [Planctomycetaceae bacterium]|jgi:DNA repair protein RecO (recombination protein O)|nr:DNA repair protein RecO [Planctomycetaceae bacterium]
MENDEAVVIRSIDFSESSLIVTLFTKRFGKIEAIAKGGRRLKSSFESALDILTQINVTFIQKKNDALNILTESQSIRRFHVLKNNLHNLHAAYYIAELVNLFTERNIPNTNLYNLITEKLSTLAKPLPTNFVNYHVAQFNFQLLHENGTQPTLDTCAECGNKIENINQNQSIHFKQNAGGIICNACTEKTIKLKQNLTIIKPETLNLLKHFKNELNNKIKKQNNTNNINNLTTNSTINETLKLLNNYINYQLNSQPKTQKYLNLQ